MWVQLKIIIHDEWLIPQVFDFVRRLQEELRRLKGRVEVLEEEARRLEGKEVRRLKGRVEVLEEEVRRLRERPQEREVSHRNKKYILCL